MEGLSLTVMDIIRSRRSVRKWKDQPVGKKQLEVLMEAAQKAPSAMNWQPYRFVLVDDHEKLDLVSKAAGQPNMAKAPLFVVGVADPKRSPKWHVIDTVIALTQIMLAAYETGLAGVLIGAFDERKVKSALNIPENFATILILALGVPDQKPHSIGRKSIQELFSVNDFNNPVN